VSGNGWCAVSLSNGIETGRSAGSRLFDKEIVLWRDADGVAHAWEDRCPHRGMRLSFGFVRGNRIACLYHGWQYGADGHCQFIPAHPELKVPGTVSVATYLCREHLGMVWMCNPAAVTASPELAIEERAVTPVRSIHIDCPLDAAVEALTARGKILDESIGLSSVRVGDLPLLIATQQYGLTKTALHIVIEGPHDTQRGAAQVVAATWAEHIRFELESQVGIGADSTAHQRVLT
jgi:nitrite reductase/ring-hydroxylating ferredoxin subunit